MRFGTAALVVMLAATVVGFAILFRLRLDHGDSLPKYSSLRSDALGLRALHDSLERVPDVTVSRTFDPLAELPARPARTIVVAGVSHKELSDFEPGAARALDQAVRAGCRIVIAMRDVRGYVDVADAREPDLKKASAEKTGDKKKPAETKVNLGMWWEVRPEIRGTTGGASPAESAPEGATAFATWSSEVTFRFPMESAWTVQYRRGGSEPVMIERSLGRGSVVLAGSAYFLSNEALQRERAPAVLAWVVGPHRHVEFHEAHLGMIRARGIAALARNYGLTGAFVLFLAAAGLFVWHRMALFVPAPEEADETALTYQQTAGLESLLRRAIDPSGLPEACMAEWRKTARPAEIVKAEAALAASPAKASAAESYNAVVRALRKR
jgi:hypothetical protein